VKSSLSHELAMLGGVAGSVHKVSDELLYLMEQLGLPASVLRVIERIPRGKGMAGQAWQTGEPVTTCNIKTDALAPIEAGARAVSAQASIAIPVLDEAGGVVSVVGFAFPDDQPFDDTRVMVCQKAAYRVWLSLVP
jgi:L-methionine (R)-S-oxide reductase